MIAAADRESRMTALDQAEPAQRLRALAVRALARMFRPRERLFAFRLRRDSGRDVLAGTSRRYTAIALIGLAGEAEETVAAVLAGREPQDVCGRLLGDIERSEDLGEVALTAWAARALGHPGAAGAVRRLKEMDPVEASFPTVEVSWSLAALVCGGLAEAGLAEGVAWRLAASFRRRPGMFPHWPAGARSPFLRRHVTCFADLVYPIQALSHYHRATGDAGALDVANRCADSMCDLQGPAGQWWWHFDARVGRVVERFPVYAVHQDSMAPMALFALRDAGGRDHADAAARGMAWLTDPPEIRGSLIDAQAGAIWRKVARHEPGKLVRGLQAAASRLHPALRAPGVNALFRPGWIDYETRPYHMGWILHAWPRAANPGPTAR